MKVPCKDCTERTLNCHSTCERYKQFFEENEKRKAELLESHRLTNTLNGYNKNKLSGFSGSKYRKGKDKPR